MKTELLSERVCWTRMQAESGEGLARIVWRKELERRTGSGLFFWGVGNAPARIIPALVRSSSDIDVLFSVMKSRPKAHDIAPSRVIAWQSYVDVEGIVRPLPSHVLVTSRAGSRNCHYALVCHSETPLRLATNGISFDPAAFRNCGAGGAVGSSQVTALLERFGPDGPSDYRIAMRARLTGGFWVKLIDPVEVSASIRAELDGGVDDEETWLDIVEAIRVSEARPAMMRSQPSLFAI